MNFKRLSKILILAGLVLAFATPKAEAAVLTGLKSYYKLQETSGTRVDSTANAHDLTDNNTVTYDLGKIGNGAKFDGSSSEYLSVADHADFDSTTAMSVSFWLYDTGGSAAGVVGKWNYGGETAAGWMFQNTRMYFGLSDGNYAELTGYTISTNTWYHVVIIYDGSLTGDSNRLKIYVNNAQATLSNSGTAVPATIPNTGYAFEIGRFNGLGRYFTGIVDEVAYWKDTALTSTDVATLYGSGIPPMYEDFDTTNPWTYIASAQDQGNGTLAVTPAIDTTGADLIIIQASSYTSSGTTITDSKSNTWTALTLYDSSGIVGTRFYYCYNPTVGTGHTFTNTNLYASLIVLAVSGSGSSPFDVENGTTGTANPLNAGSITPSVNGELIVVGFGGWSTNPNGMSDLRVVGSQAYIGGTSMSGAFGFKTQTTAAAINVGVYQSASTYAAVSSASFKKVSSGGGGTARRRYQIIIQ